MAFKILITEQANQDLAEIVRFTARQNPAAAEKLGLNLIGSLRNLGEFPFLGRVVPERDNPALREIVCAPYRIIYRVSEEQKAIEVLRFWHGARGRLETGTDASPLSSG